MTTQESEVAGYGSLGEEIEARGIVVRALERMEHDDPQGVRHIRRNAGVKV